MSLLASSPLGLPDRACPQCGGAILADEEVDFRHCRYCDSRLWLDPTGAVRHELVPFVVRKEELPKRVGRWLASREVSGLPTNVSVRPLFFPFWVLEGTARTTIAAAAPLLAPFEGFRLPGGDRRAFHEELLGETEAIPASTLLTVVEVALSPGSPDALRRRIRLVHLPFWAVDFRLWGEEHRLWIDAAAGQLLPHTTPASDEGRLDWGYSALLAATFAIETVGSWLLFGGGASTFLGTVVLVGSVPLSWAGLRRTIARLENR